MAAVQAEGRFKRLRPFCVGVDHESPPREFVLGTFDRQVTIYDQQVRALNLAFELQKIDKSGSTDQLGENEKWTAVIGAGVAGLTFAAASLWLGKRVVLVERQPVPCHLQRGCDIRWLHPHIYHWPRAGSQQPYAGLPLLTWSEATATDVIRQILKQWEEIKESKGNRRLQQFFSAKHKFDRNEMTLSVFTPQPRISISEPIPLQRIVYAVGFGVERAHPLLTRHSYWENDSFHQLQPDHPQNVETSWLVLGMGDGGLIDLQRLCIENYRQDRIVEDLFSSDSSLVQSLRNLQYESSNQRNLYGSLERLASSDRFVMIDSRLTKRKRYDTKVTLINTKSFREEFDNCNASFLNRVLVHRLHQIGSFDYVQGTVWNIEKRPFSSDDKIGVVFNSDGVLRSEEFDRLIMRYGSDRSKWLRQAGYEACDELQLQLAEDRKPLKPYWSPGWWVEEGHEPREYVNPLCEVMAFTFVNTLSSIVQSAVEAKRSNSVLPITFRMTLHRVIPFHDGIRIQQICSYAGTRADDLEDQSSIERVEDVGSAMERRTVGRVFELTDLTVGLCARLARPLLFKSKAGSNEMPSDLQSDMKSLGLNSKARHMNDAVRSVLAIPLLSPELRPGKKRQTLVMLYADATDADCFDKKMIEQFRLALVDFSKQVDDIAKSALSEVRVVEWEWPQEDLSEPDLLPFATLVKSRGVYGKLLDENGNFDGATHSFEVTNTFEIAPNR